MKYLAVAVAAGVVIWLLLRSRNANAASSISTPPKSQGWYGQANTNPAPPNGPATAETNPTNAQRSGFAADCGTAIRGGADVAMTVGAGHPKVMAAATAARIGGPYACQAVDLLGSEIQSTARSFGVKIGSNAARMAAVAFPVTAIANIAVAKVPGVKQTVNATAKGAGWLAGNVAKGAKKLCFFC